jgi:SAM-dependent methyltransferase
MVAEQRTTLDFSDVLHVAPEATFETYLRSKSKNYLSIDLQNAAMARMDITALDLPDDSQSMIWISHLLEHVENDDAAISEMYRVLRNSGCAFVQVPIWRTTTFEDFAIRDPAERTKHFYQPDHVRLYGLDLVDRFTSRGFEAEVHRAQDFGPEPLLRYGLSFASTNEVFVFRKPTRPLSG